MRQPALRRETWRQAGDVEEDTAHHNRITWMDVIHQACNLKITRTEDKPLMDAVD